MFEDVNYVHLANAKLQLDPNVCALKMMDCLCKVSELVNGNPKGKTNSKDETRKATIKPLNPQRLRYIYGMFKIIHNLCTLYIRDACS